MSQNNVAPLICTPNRGRWLLALAAACLLAACGGGGGGDSGSSSAAATPITPVPDGGLSQVASLGKKIFSDQSLSASGKQSCATCHNPDNAHAQSNDLAVQLGGANLDVPGFRAVPSLRYLNLTPAFFFASDGTPTGGFNRDGRVNTLAEQSERPFLAPHEMANAGRADVIAKLKSAAYVEEFRKVFGAAILDNSDDAFNRIQVALQQYQKEDTDFHPYDSKYDQFLAGKVPLNAAELRGLALFNNPTKGNCVACHLSAKGSDGSSPLFTDFTFDNLGVPRNPAIAATADPAYFDLGLCGPDRTDLSSRSELCGKFKVPTLRNVATRKVFFHNGYFKTLREAVSFYVKRDTNPELWYPVDANGAVQKFNDLPEQYRKNVNVTEVPYNRQPNMPPALSESEVDDVVQFLGTLTDGYKAQ
ncbi:cytochrome-c peroxidase [Collimonas sp.]|jgi:cytochrome c peroxidase|uniref:cytochrome-c peroxidase n=1 Tax=Collimonas sp. TaxID=1963772 RepID=UPI002C4AAFBC|nr:cytochrome c peroxidase [Collimonas sp.]HWW04545.1 cytochrome c peroxidase [Collimonas sp.]